MSSQDRSFPLQTRLSEQQGRLFRAVAERKMLSLSELTRDYVSKGLSADIAELTRHDHEEPSE